MKTRLLSVGRVGEKVSCHCPGQPPATQQTFPVDIAIQVLNEKQGQIDEGFNQRENELPVALMALDNKGVRWSLLSTFAFFLGTGDE